MVLEDADNLVGLERGSLKEFLARKGGRPAAMVARENTPTQMLHDSEVYFTQATRDGESSAGWVAFAGRGNGCSC